MSQESIDLQPGRQGTRESSGLRPAPSAVWFAVGMLSMGLAASAYGAPAPVSDLRTAHYDIHVEGLDAQDVGNMLEQLHAQLTNYFGTAPSGRLTLAVYATREKWAAALVADRQFVPPNAGGYYAPYTRKVYAWIQPSAYSTRQLVLHEAAHQFHWLVATGNNAPSANWYTEGLAEYFGMHNWDGKSLQTGVVPAITLEDYPAAAWRKYEAAGADLKTMCSHADRPEAWALVRFLLETRPKQFRQLAARLDRQDDPLAAWNQAFGADASGLSREFGAWLRAHAQPWQIVWVAWQQRGDAIECDSQTVSITLLKETPQKLAVRIEPQTTGGAAGLVFGYESTSDFYLFQADPGRNVRLLRRQNNSWVSVPLPALSPADDCRDLAVTRDPTSTTLWVGGKKVATIAAVGRVGLTAENGRTLFHVN